MAKRQLFVPSPNIRNPQQEVIVARPQPYSPKEMASAGYVVQTSPNYNYKPKGNPMTNAASAVLNAIPNETKVELLNTAVNYVGGKMKGGGNKGGGSNGASSYALSKAPNPRLTNLNTGIDPAAYTSDYFDAKENHCSPLHMTSCVVEFPSDTAAKLYTYFQTIIAFDVQSKAQNNIGFNLRIDTDFTGEKILAAMNALINALQVYLYYKSIISYHSNPVNKNEGMIALRSKIGPDSMETLFMLERRLSDTPCPPKLLELLRYLSGNYLSGDNQGSPMIKFTPLPCTDTMMDANYLTAALTGLQSTANNMVYTLLRRAVPNWNPKIIYDVDTIPVFDKNFLTIWANAPFKMHSTTTKSFPFVTSEDEAIAYNSFTNNLDGVAFALNSVFLSSTSKYIPGLLVPGPGGGANTGYTRRSFYEVSGVKQFYIAGTNAYITRSRQETYLTDTTGVTQVGAHLMGADKCLNVSANSIRETAMKSIDYLMSLDMIKSEKQSGFNRSGSRPNRRPGS